LSSMSMLDILRCRRSAGRSRGRYWRSWRVLGLKTEVHIGSAGVQLRSCIEDGVSTVFYPHAICKPFNSPPLLYKLSAHLRKIRHSTCRLLRRKQKPRRCHETHSLGRWLRRSVLHNYGAVCVWRGMLQLPLSLRWACRRELHVVRLLALRRIESAFGASSCRLCNSSTVWYQ
jgi:hypothetical protein